MARTRSLLVAGLIVSLLAVVRARPAVAQEPSPNKTPEQRFNEQYGTYLDLLQGYRAYDADKARKLGDFWERLEATDHPSMGVLIHRTPLELAPLSQMALTDLSIDALGHHQQRIAIDHLSVVEQWIDFALPLTPLDPAAPQRRFARNWYLAVIWLWFGRGDGPFAKKAIDHARVLFPEDPEVLLSSATFEDMQYNRHRRERPHRVPQETRVVVQTGVVRALHDYRESIRLDPKGVEARIRLAYLLHIIEPSHVEEPLTLLQEARALEEKPPLSYLAALFTGLIEEHAGHLDEAARWYRNAIALCPRAQTARLALSHVQLDQDQRQSAQNTLRPLTGGLPTQDNICEPDPWRIYDFGQAWRFDDQIGLMRRQVREPVEESRP